MRRCCAFTLIELLVVITIISLLISILLPALASARKAARTTKCLAQTRSLGVGMSLYVMDHKGWYAAGSETDDPTWFPDCPSEKDWWDICWTYAEAIYPYMSNHGSARGVEFGDLDNVQFYTCPEDPLALKLPGALSYHMNGHRNPYHYLDGMTYHYNSSQAKLPAEAGQYQVHVNELWVPDPSGTFLLVDVNAPYTGSSQQIYRQRWTYGDAYVERGLKVGVEQFQNPAAHNGAFNWLMVDGHSETLKLDDTWGTGDAIFPAGIWTKTKGD